MKTNFKISKTVKIENKTSDSQNIDETKKGITEQEFEEFISRSGAAGSYMVFRSTKKDDELGLDQL